MVDVFFRGSGAWWSEELECGGFHPEQVTLIYEAGGIFRITDHDAMVYFARL